MFILKTPFMRYGLVRLYRVCGLLWNGSTKLCQHNRAPSVTYFPGSCFAERSLELRLLLPLRDSFGIDVMRSTLADQLFLSITFAVKQGVTCKSFFKHRQKSPLHLVHLLCNSGAPLNLIVIRLTLMPRCFVSHVWWV